MDFQGSQGTKTKSVFIALAIFLFAGLVMYNVSSPGSRGAIDSKLNVASTPADEQPTFTYKILDFEDGLNPLDISVSSYYINKLGPIGELYGWLGENEAIVDVYKDFTLSASLSSVEDVQKQQPTAAAQEGGQEAGQDRPDASDEHDYEWLINGQAYSGPEVTLQVEELGSFEVQLTDKVTGLSASKTIHAKYVRREIRELSDDDRNSFLDTLKKLYLVEPDEAATYGEAFTTIKDLVNNHLNGAAARDCDHLHDGMGFLASHSGMTNMLEVSLQMIDPSVTIPYWDYTIDGEVVKQMGSLEVLTKSVLFSEDYFGELWPEDGVVKTGRWAYQKAETMDREVDSVYNAYGYGRSPWNVGKSPYMNRFGDFNGRTYSYFPSCTDHKDMIEVDSLYDFIFTIMYDPHGTVHATVGGMTGIDVYNTLLDAGETDDAASSAATELFAVTKNLWRAELLDCPTYCSDDTPEDECVCTCPDTTQGSYPIEYFDYITAGLSNSELNNMYLDMICGYYGAIKYGEMIESASTLDPSFWPIHPTIERLLLRWRMYKDEIDENWVANSSTTVGGIGTGYCEGHDEFDQLSYLNLNGRTDYTNRELYELITPFEDSLPYVYHTFLWDHCSDYGSVSFDRAN